MPLACCVALSACFGDVAVVEVCTAPAVRDCACDAGAAGSQACGDDHAWQPCSCQPSPADDAGDTGPPGDTGLDSSGPDDSVPGDGGPPDGPTPDASGCDAGEIYCEGQGLFQCQADGGARSLATCDERCVDGACATRPEALGDACSGQSPCPDDGGLACHDAVCLTTVDAGPGEGCWDDLECAADNPICFGYQCQVGSEGDPCDSAGDCASTAPVCHDGRCQDGSAGDACSAAADCAAAAPICTQAATCSAGATKDACSADADCAPASPLCGPGASGCQAGAEGDPCDGAGDCDGSHYCGPDSHCHDGTAGDPCNSPDECRGEAPVCDDTGHVCRIPGDGEPCGAGCPSGLHCVADLCYDGSSGDPCQDETDCSPAARICDTGAHTCRAPVKGDPCTDDSDCPSPLYCANGLCQDGASGDWCDTAADCANTHDKCAGAPSTCQGRVEPDPCGPGATCPSPLYCANGACQDGSTGDYCNTTPDCLDANATCQGSPATCQGPGKGDACVTTDDCSGALYCANDVCQDGATGDYCTVADDCVHAFDACAGDGSGPHTCTTRVEGDACASDDQCPTSTGLYCASSEGRCRDGSTGDRCDSTADCDLAIDVCKGGPTTCQHRVDGDPCASDTECPAGLYCASSEGKCRDGSTGDRCDSTADCDEANDICSGSPATCHDRIEGDPCSIDAECPTATGLYCATSDGTCHDGSTGDRCDSTADCDETDDICKGAPATCQDRGVGDPCASGSQCPAPLYCASSVGQCQDGSTGSYCNSGSNCVHTYDLCQGSPATCTSRQEGDVCGSDAQCPPGDYCFAMCYDGSSGDPCLTTSQCDLSYQTCSSFHCTSRSEWDSCGSDAQCPPSLYCESQHCYDGSSGDPCGGPGECQTGLSCISGHCQ